jgi:DNA-directed RNA polymerase subunit beta'
MFDFGKQFDQTKDRIVTSMKSLFPRQGKIHSIRLKKIWAEDKLSPEDYEAQKEAKFRERTWSIPVFAEIELVDNATNKVIDREDKVRLALIPRMTSRGSFIVNGNEYQVSNMLRLKPGVYTIIQNNGVLDSWVNLSQGKNFNVMLDPKTGMFTAKIGTSNVKLYPLLLGMGINKADIEAVWGKELTDQNSKKSDYDAEILKAHKAFIGKPASDSAEALANLTTYFSKTSISPETTIKTLGKEFSKVDANLLLATTKKVLGVSRGEQKTDDRDALEFKTIHAVEDLLPERVQKTSLSIARSIDRNIDRRDKIKYIVSPDTFGGPIETFFTGSDEFSGLAQVTPQTNPLSIIGETNKTTTLGPGGIPSVHSITMEARAVNPTSFGFLDPVHTPEAERVGTTLHLASAAKVGNDLVIKLIDPKTMQYKDLTPSDMVKLTVAFRDQYELKGNKFVAKAVKIKAIQNGSFVEVGKNDVDYVFPSAKMFFDVSTNMVPFLPTDQGNRAMMASKMLEQALPLKYREIPLVQPHLAKGVTYPKILGEAFSSVALETGTVTKVTPTEIRLRDNHGKVHSSPIYSKFPLNSQVYMDSEPTVSVGEKVKKGQLIADSNYTKNGTLALGTNLTTAYVPYKGYNFEDGIVISEGASKKLTSLHMHQESVDVDTSTVLNLKKFNSYYPNILDVEASKKLDDEGVIKIGQKVKFGDVLIAALKQESMGPESEMLRKLHRAFVQPYRNSAVTWTDDDEAIVSDVVKQPKKVTVYLTTEETAKVGDKLSSRHAAKGVVTRIIPDAEMPKTKDGTTVEILLNPNGVIGRINLGQILETAAGKLADKTGKIYMMDNFSGENYTEKLRKELKDAGISDKEDLVDPSMNKTIPGVLVGKQYIMKLDHPTRKKFSARSTGGYTMDLQPHGGGGSGGQTIGKMEFAAMLAHGAKENLREMATVKSQRNDEFWRFLHTGNPLPAPQVPFSFQKLEAMIKGMGVDVVKEGNKLQLAPMTNKQILEMSNGEIKDALAVRAKDLRPEKDGIFDPAVTGGLQGKYWNHVKLAEPVPNPIFEMAIRELLGITEAEYREYVDGRKWILKTGDPVEQGAKNAITGGEAIRILLSKINVEKDLQTLKARAPALRGSDLEKINRKLRYLSALKEKDLNPTVYVLDNFPVIPASFRPVYALPNGNLGISQVNELYRDTILVNNQLREAKLPEDMKINLRRDLYDGLKGIVGLGTSLSGRQRKGFIEQIAGDTPKTGYFQSAIMGRRQEMSGRSTVIPEPGLGLDDIALPEAMAWKLYEPFIIREIVQMGYTPLQAKEHLQQKDELAKKALEVVMQDRPVMMNRAPTLHKFSIMALMPQITSGKAIKTNPLVIQGYNMDFDGDTASIHVPIGEEARRETFKMLPSANLFSPKDGTLMNLPSQEAVLGLYLMTYGGKETNAKFRTLTEAMKAFSAHKYDLSDKVMIGGKKMTLGLAVINGVLPAEYRDNTLVASKKNLATLLNNLAKTKPQVFADVVSKLKDVGNEYAYKSGFSVGLEDLEVDTKSRDKIFAEAERKSRKSGIGAAYAEAARKLDDSLKISLTKSKNPFYQMVASGARGNMAQLRQILAAPVLVKDMNDQVIPVPIKRSFSEGLGIADYLATMPGARKGIIDRALMTSKPGAFSKELVSATIQERVSIPDCGTMKGIPVSVNDDNTLDRYLAKGVGRIADRNDLITAAVLTKLRGKVSTVMVRSPSTCEAPEGVCQMCYGLDEHGKKIEVGRNVGVLAAQTITEPMAQMTMRTFHTGSVAESGKTKSTIGGFQRVKELLEMHETVRDKATLADIDGKVDRIQKSPAGGYEVVIDGRDHFVDPGRTPTVKAGQTVKKGDSISDGVIKPQELLPLKGIEATRDYLVSEIKREFDAQGIKIKNKIFETAIRPLVNTAQVIEAGSSLHMPGDMTTLSAIYKFNKGKTEDDQIKFEPKLKGVNTYPLISNDWLTRLNYQQLSKTLTQGASQGWKTDIQSAPVAAYAYGVMMGREKKASEETVESEGIIGMSLEDQDIPEIIEEFKCG